MSGSEEGVPLPEYEVSQYFPRQGAVSEEQRARLREEYGRVRAYYKMRPGAYIDLQRWLNQARIGTTYDIYLARSVRLALAATVLGALFGALLTWGLASSGVLASLHAPLRVNHGFGVRALPPHHQRMRSKSAFSQRLKKADDSIVLSFALMPKRVSRWLSAWLTADIVAGGAVEAPVARSLPAGRIGRCERWHGERS